MPSSDDRLAALHADVCRRVPDPPGLDEVVEDAGRQRLSAYYVYSALLAGVIDDHALAPARWPPELAEPMRRMGLTRFAPRTERGLDAALTPAEQATRRSPDRQLEFARLLVDLINHGTFGPLCGNADRVRLARSARRDDPELELELIRGWRVVGTCPVKDHWELIAQYLAGVPLAEAQPGETQPGKTQPGKTQPADTPEQTVAGRLEETGIAHAVSLGVTLAVGLYPLGTVAGLGTRLIRGRVRAGHEQADALGRLGNELRALRAQTDAELAGRSQ